MLDYKNWKVALKVYKEHPIDALTLGQQFIAIKQSLKRGRKGKGKRDAIAALDLAIDALFLHTDFNKVSRKLYRERLEGTIKPKQEQRLRKLGMKI